MFIADRELQALLDEIVAEQNRELRQQRVNQVRELLRTMTRMLELQHELQEARGEFDVITADIVSVIASRHSRVRVVESSQQT